MLCLCLISLGACGKINEDQSADKVQKAIYELAVFEKNYGVLGDAARATIKILQDMTDFSQLEHITLSYACVVFLPDRVIIEVRWIGGASLKNGLVIKKVKNE